MALYLLFTKNGHWNIYFSLNMDTLYPLLFKSTQRAISLIVHTLHAPSLQQLYH